MEDQILELFKIWSPYMLYIDATTADSWFSQNENKNIGMLLISPLQKTAIFIATHKKILINGYNWVIFSWQAIRYYSFLY